MERNTLKVNIPEVGDFEFFLEPNIRELQQVENKLAARYGGRKGLQEERLDIEELKRKSGEDAKALVLYTAQKMDYDKAYHLAYVSGTAKVQPCDIEELTPTQYDELLRAFEVARSTFQHT